MELVEMMVVMGKDRMSGRAVEAEEGTGREESEEAPDSGMVQTFG